ncbi:hypothetical protein K461DRAFT_279675 [Myriangium duriaei CBS 260.36]|uniref:Uncharacterized protein n=1 Tax=Myriangium duriaei CBS 260.36 TaxID=1168546 RepID=A0A9P4J2N9_9PEZI|nr:hypothetical protein K461DRAFT_279675 [Myriangium duriaei CBS 260.36]
MSKAMNSPTARMLRSSRLFSMPPPLPAPSMDQTLASGMIRTSDTATRPYPTRQAITAPASSRHRGDWGLKRPLPQKTNNTSSPHVRINAVDTLEHITDFDSAADHTLTYKKWQEMNVHMTLMPPKTGTGQYPTSPLPPSAFTGLSDNTIVQDDRQRGINKLPLGVERATRLRAMKGPGVADDHMSRWRYEGPNLPSMPQAEFDRYVRRVVESPEMRREFRQFLISVRVERKREDELERMRKETGFDPSSQEDVARLERACKIVDPEKDVDEYILRLRNKSDDLSSELPRLIGEFFDLPPFPRNRRSNTGHGTTKLNLLVPEEEETVSHATHPSAGLAYSKSNAFIENHPIHGPQLERTPTEARVLRPRESSVTQAESALLGLAGFAVKDITAKNIGNRNQREPDSIAEKTRTWNLERPGSNKLWATPAYAFVDEQGRICMRINYPDNETVAVKTGGPDPRPAPTIGNQGSEAFRIFKQAANYTNSKRGARQVPAMPNASSNKAESDVKLAPRATPLGSQELKDFKKIIKQPGQDLGKTLVQSLKSGDSSR